MKILAKTTGCTLVCSNYNFLDAYKYRLVEYNAQVRDWNNRGLLDVECFVEDSVNDSELDDLGFDEFVKKYNPEKKAEPEAKAEAEEDDAPRAPKKKARKK